MSRIGKKPVAIPAGVSVKVSPDRRITVESSGKKLEMTHRPEVSVKVDDAAKAVVIDIDEKDHDNREVRAFWGSTRAHINNMVAGVTKGYEKVLEVNGVGWGATLAGNKLNLKLGYANVITKMVPAGVTVAVDKAGQAFFDDRPVTQAELGAALQDAARANPETEVQLRADQGVPYGRVVEVMGEAQKAGLNRIGFVAEAPGGAESPMPAASR